MKRCNHKAVWYSPQNGYRACNEHAENGMLLCAEAGPEPFGRCDKPIETPDQFWARVAKRTQDERRKIALSGICG